MTVPCGYQPLRTDTLTAKHIIILVFIEEIKKIYRRTLCWLLNVQNCFHFLIYDIKLLSQFWNANASN